MKSLCILPVLVLAYGIGVGAPMNAVRLDSLVDVFPLSVGNQWIYGYDYEWEDIGVITDWSDTGSVTLTVITAIEGNDSTRWIIRESGNHWTRLNGGPWSGPELRIDTIEIVEVNAGNHWLYRNGVPAEMRTSILPFLTNLSDTARVFRYGVVDSTGCRTFRSHEDPIAPFYHFIFQQGVGLRSVSMFDGGTGFPSYGTYHALRSYTITGITDPKEQERPVALRLDQNYPNPFNPVTTIRYQLPSHSHVTLTVFDLLGREVATLVDGTEEPGEKRATFDGSALASGVYFYRLKAGDFVQTRKLMLVR